MHVWVVIGEGKADEIVTQGQTKSFVYIFEKKTEENRQSHERERKRERERERENTTRPASARAHAHTHTHTHYNKTLYNARNTARRTTAPAKLVDKAPGGPREEALEKLSSFAA